ncbi:hypothetical protein HOK96_01310, partial [bacterium]|nr:hypothetical protein [bacterium]
DEITLSVNKVEGDKSQSSALLSVPVKEGQGGTIQTKNNASVSNDSDWYRIRLPKKITEPRSSDGKLFARIKILHQRDKNFDYLDILIGKGDHAHITFYFDGNGKYIDQRRYKCSLEGVLKYQPDTKKILPSTLVIVLDDYTECLVLTFDHSADGELSLTEAIFK